MILNERTISFLKTFSNINPGLLIRPGNVMKTISHGKTMMARVVLDQEFPVEFAIYDLSRFVSVLGLFQEPALTFLDTKLIINSADQKAKLEYAYADPKTFTSAPEKDIIPNKDVHFELSQDDLKRLLQATSMLSLTDIAFIAKDGKIAVECLKADDPTSNKFSITIGETDKTFQAFFKVENMKILLRNYVIAIDFRGFAHFKAEDIEYIIAMVSENSNFGA